MEKIKATAIDPLGMRDFWSEADEPFQALATILGIVSISYLQKCDFFLLKNGGGLFGFLIMAL